MNRTCAKPVITLSGGRQEQDLCYKKSNQLFQFQIIGIIFSFSLAKGIRKAKSERERRRWEIQERMISAHTSLDPHDEKKAPVMYVPFHGQTLA